MKVIKSLALHTILALGLALGIASQAIASEESERFFRIKELAEQGHALEQVYLGTYYEDGLGVRQDYEKALHWYKESAKQNNSEGQLQVGRAYYKGQGIEQDYEKARYWYLKSAKQNNANSQSWLGLMYQYGKGVQPNSRVAKEWYGKSCDNGNPVGCKSYRELNEQGY